MFGANQAAEDDCHHFATPSKREAMDWSLVLLSQGIESTLLDEGVDGGWLLIVPGTQFASAEQALRLYRLENSAWPLRRSLPMPGFAFDWTVLAWVGVLVFFFVLQSEPRFAFEAAGISNAGLVRAGEWWRPLTATMLHADLGHLAMNAVFGFLLLGIAMGRFGSGIALLVATVSGALANVLTALWRDDLSSALGASGVVMAALGMLAADAGIQQWRRKQPWRLVIEGVVSGVLMFVLLGLSPTSDVAAHAGGFVVGLMLGAPMAALPLTTIRRARWSFVAGVAYTAMVIVAWLMALSGAPY